MGGRGPPGCGAPSGSGIYQRGAVGSPLGEGGGFRGSAPPVPPPRRGRRPERVSRYGGLCPGEGFPWRRGGGRGSGPSTVATGGDPCLPPEDRGACPLEREIR